MPMGIGDHQAGGALEVDDDELRVLRRLVDALDDAVLGDVAKDGDAVGLARQPAPLRDPAFGIGIDDTDLRPAFGKLEREKKRGGGLAAPPLGLAKEMTGMRTAPSWMWLL